ncbi:MAG TPA: DUF2207 domain-containing protein [Acidimicrobiales bacterium]|nr:DUF2207 domain-containing protein [Acidimicrobiales bacterium]
MSSVIKRRQKANRFCFAAACFAGLVVAAAIYFSPEKIDFFWATAEIDTGGSARITEVIDYDFAYKPDKHGIYRDIPDLVESSIIEVSSPSAPDQYEMRGNERIRIGSPYQTVSGNHRYRIVYDLETLVSEDLTQTAWNGVGFWWNVPIQKAELNILSPFELLDPQCRYGSRWDSPKECEILEIQPGHLKVKLNQLDKEGVTITALFGDSLASAPEISGLPSAPNSGNDFGNLLFLAFVGLAATLFGVLMVVLILKYFGRDKVRSGGAVDAAFGAETETLIRRADVDELSDQIATSFTPPKEIDAYQGGILLTERVTEDHKTAWLLERAISGEIKITEDESKTVLIDQLPLRDSGVLKTMFGNREKITLGSFDSQFAEGWEKLEKELNSWQEESELWANYRTQWVRFLGWVVAVLGLVFIISLPIIFGSVAFYKVLISTFLYGAGLGMAYRYWELAVRNPQGTGLWIQVEGFRKFLHESEAKHVEAAADQGRLREYSAWAVALGESDQWNDAISQSGKIKENYVDDYIFVDQAFNNRHRMTSTLSRPKSSSNNDWDFGDFSSGGSFSGGGGGGGGSW